MYQLRVFIHNDIRFLSFSFCISPCYRPRAQRVSLSGPATTCRNVGHGKIYGVEPKKSAWITPRFYYVDKRKIGSSRRSRPRVQCIYSYFVVKSKVIKEGEEGNQIAYAILIRWSRLSQTMAYICSLYLLFFLLRRVASSTEENKNKLYRLCVCVMFFTEPIRRP